MWANSCADYYAAAAMYEQLSALSNAELHKRSFRATRLPGMSFNPAIPRIAGELKEKKRSVRVLRHSENATQRRPLVGGLVMSALATPPLGRKIWPCHTSSCWPLPLWGAGAWHFGWSRYGLADLAHEAPLWVAVSIVIFVAASLSSTVGFAFSAIAAAMIFHLVSDTVEAVQIMMVASIAIQAYSVAGMWRTISWRACCAFPRWRHRNDAGGDLSAAQLSPTGLHLQHGVGARPLWRLHVLQAATIDKDGRSLQRTWLLGRWAE